MNEIKKINPLSFLSTLEANPERDEWIKQREKELAEQTEKEASYQMQKNVESSGVPRRYWHVDFDTYISRNEKDETINSLKEEIQKEKTEKEKWYTMLFRKFTIKIGGKPVEVNNGLTDAYIEKSTQLAEWENRNGDELISLGSSYKRYRVQNWKDYLKEKTRPRSLEYDMSR